MLIVGKGISKSVIKDVLKGFNIYNCIDINDCDTGYELEIKKPIPAEIDPKIKEFFSKFNNVSFKSIPV